MLLKLKKWSVVVWTGSSLLRIQASGSVDWLQFAQDTGQWKFLAKGILGLSFP